MKKYKIYLLFLLLASVNIYAASLEHTDNMNNLITHIENVVQQYEKATGNKLNMSDELANEILANTKTLDENASIEETGKYCVAQKELLLLLREEILTAIAKNNGVAHKNVQASKGSPDSNIEATVEKTEKEFSRNVKLAFYAVKICLNEEFKKKDIPSNTNVASNNIATTSVSHYSLDEKFMLESASTPSVSSSESSQDAEIDRTQFIPERIDISSHIGKYQNEDLMDSYLKYLTYKQWLELQDEKAVRSEFIKIITNRIPDELIELNTFRGDQTIQVSLRKFISKKIELGQIHVIRHQLELFKVIIKSGKNLIDEIGSTDKKDYAMKKMLKNYSNVNRMTMISILTRARNEVYLIATQLANESNIKFTNQKSYRSLAPSTIDKETAKIATTMSAASTDVPLDMTTTYNMQNMPAEAQITENFWLEKATERFERQKDHLSELSYIFDLLESINIAFYYYRDVNTFSLNIVPLDTKHDLLRHLLMYDTKTITFETYKLRQKEVLASLQTKLKTKAHFNEIKDKNSNALLNSGGAVKDINFEQLFQFVDGVFKAANENFDKHREITITSTDKTHRAAEHSHGKSEVLDDNQNADGTESNASELTTVMIDNIIRHDVYTGAMAQEILRTVSKLSKFDSLTLRESGFNDLVYQACYANRFSADNDGKIDNIVRDLKLHIYYLNVAEKKSSLKKSYKDKFYPYFRKSMRQFADEANSLVLELQRRKLDVLGAAASTSQNVHSDANANESHKKSEAKKYLDTIEIRGKTLTEWLKLLDKPEGLRIQLRLAVSNVDDMLLEKIKYRLRQIDNLLKEIKIPIKYFDDVLTSETLAILTSISNDYSSDYSLSDRADTHTKTLIENNVDQILATLEIANSKRK